MKKLPTFMLVRRPEIGSEEVNATNDLFNEVLKRTFGATSAYTRRQRSLGEPQQVRMIKKDLSRNADVSKVGVLDLGSYVAGLPELLEKLNRAQSIFTLFEIQAPVPAGLRKSGEGFAAWVKKRGARGVSASDRREMEPQIIDEEFFVAAEDIRKAMAVDYLVGLSPDLVAGIHAGTKVPFWNHFASTSMSTVLVSTADLREFSRRAARPFEVGVAVLIVAALFVAVNSRIKYHDDTGCLFDYNESRVSLADTIRQLRIDDQCRDKMTPEQLKACRSMLRALKTIKISAP